MANENTLEHMNGWMVDGELQHNTFSRTLACHFIEGLLTAMGRFHKLSLRILR